MSEQDKAEIERLNDEIQKLETEHDTMRAERDKANRIVCELSQLTTVAGASAEVAKWTALVDSLTDSLMREQAADAEVERLRADPLAHLPGMVNIETGEVIRPTAVRDHRTGEPVVLDHVAAPEPLPVAQETP